MWLLAIGLLLFIAKVAAIGPAADWSWWIVGAPFAGAVLWWRFVDATGITKRREMKKMDERKEQRRERSLEALGLGIRSPKKVQRAPEESRTKRADEGQQAARKAEAPGRGSRPQ
jgi:small Trp-rich protein